MFSSIAGFTAPSFMATFVLQSHDQALASPHGRVLSPLALIAPALTLVTMVGLTSAQNQYNYDEPWEKEIDYLAGLAPDETKERDCLTGRALVDERQQLMNAEEEHCQHMHGETFEHLRVADQRFSQPGDRTVMVDRI